MSKYYSPKEASKFTGYNITTLKRYELMGILVPKRNPKNNYRMYCKDELKKFRKPAGMLQFSAFDKRSVKRPRSR